MSKRRFGFVARGAMIWSAPLVFFPLSTARWGARVLLGSEAHSPLTVRFYPFMILVALSCLISLADCFLKSPGGCTLSQVGIEFALLFYFLCWDELPMPPGTQLVDTVRREDIQQAVAPRALTLVGSAQRDNIQHAVAPAAEEQVDIAPQGRSQQAKRGKISVVLPCLNETYVVETVKSFCERTPSESLQEILVVDDGSSPPLLGKLKSAGLDDRCPFRVLRHEKPWGLMIAKQTGGDAAVGKYIGFFDCHVAPSLGWHKEIIDLLEEKSRRLVVPQIGDLDLDTYDMKKDASMVFKTKCYIDLNADFWWYDDDSPFIPAISGGLVATSREWWKDSGGFDSGMRGWGGENSDQSLRAWLCGGDVVKATTSRIAHMWRVGSDTRTTSRYSWVGKQTDNLQRVAASWFDDFAGMFHNVGIHPTVNVSETLQRKRRLGCKPFVFYMHRFRRLYRDAAVLPASVFRIRAQDQQSCIHKNGEGYRLGACEDATWLHFANLIPDGFPSEDELKTRKKSLVSSPQVVCGYHKAARCEDCPQGNGASWCNGDCSWVFGKCLLKTELPEQSRRRGARKCCSGIREYHSMYCFDSLKDNGPIAYQCNVEGDNGNQQYMFQSNGVIRHSSGHCLGANAFGLASMDCDSDFVTHWERVDEYEPEDMKLYENGVKKHGLSEDLPDH